MIRSLARTFGLLAAIIMAAFAVHGAESGRTTNDGVFSSAQALRGRLAFRENCASGCHLTEMTGSDRAPGLAGDSFMLRWNGQNLSDLFQRIRATMPQTAPHSLSDQKYTDIVAYILSANGLPTGNGELTTDVAVLQSIKFVPAAGGD